jgi:hypothetical protein
MDNFKEESFRPNAIKNKDSPKNNIITELDICVVSSKYIWWQNENW